MQQTASYVGPVKLGNTLYFVIVTTNTSDVPTDGDSTPTGTVYDATVANAMAATVTITKIATGTYSVAVDVTTGNNFAAGEGHTLAVAYAISSSNRKQAFRFTVT